MNLQLLTQQNPDLELEEIMEDDFLARPVFLPQLEDEIGIVEDILMEDSGRFRYLVVQAGSWLDNRYFLLPIGRSDTESESRGIVIQGIEEKQQLAELPAYNNSNELDSEYEEAVRRVFRSSTETQTASEEGEYSYDSEPDLYQLSEDKHQTIKLYEERLIARKQRLQVGEVIIAKRVETETAELEVPVEKEKVVVKINEVDASEPAEPAETAFEAGVVAKIKVHEEKAEIAKETFVTKEVEINKEVKQEVIKVEETVRKERIELDGEENAEIER